ncbi:Hypothetical predicted protein [Mytilus galloprovincialis]|uniref:Uncharacterized protein n=1 Tax=Mytilus galloprovincialis TaxID=29158 RepID=A0A8B6E922_MYTGA|nr:Hypothetical predicted protein [Mytilus galloprovincialis]
MDFFLDIVCSFMLNTGYIVAECRDVTIYDWTLAKWKMRIFISRLLLGFIANVGVLLIVCSTHRETFIEGAASIGLFASAIVFMVVLYGISGYTSCAMATDDEPIDDSSYILIMLTYRIQETILDILIIFYNLVLSEWMMTDFTIVVTALLCADLVLNIVMYVKNMYDAVTMSADEEKYILCLCFLFFSCCTFCMICKLR